MMIFYTPKILALLKRNMHLPPSTAHKIIHPFCGLCLANRIGLNVIVKTKAGYVVYSESKGADGKRKRLSKPYKTRGEAQKRLNAIDYFKAHKND